MSCTNQLVDGVCTRQMVQAALPSGQTPTYGASLESPWQLLHARAAHVVNKPPIWCCQRFFSFFSHSSISMPILSNFLSSSSFYLSFIFGLCSFDYYFFYLK
jgi:hypothetical protein